MTTEAAPTTATAVADAERTALEAVVAELEGRPMSQFRTLREPAVAAERRAEELGDAELAYRARLLQVGVLLREGRSARGRPARAPGARLGRNATAARTCSPGPTASWPSSTARWATCRTRSPTPCSASRT